MQGAHEVGWGGGRGSASQAFQKSPHSPAAEGKEREGSDRPTKQLPENASPQLYRDSTDSSLLLHAHRPGCQLTHKSFHSRNSIEGLASDKTQEEKFIDLFI